MSRMRERISENIASHGQHVQFVGPDGKGGLPFIYTIGNAGHHLPELLVIGAFPPEAITPILNRIGADMRRTGKAPGQEIWLGGQFPLRCHFAGSISRRDYTIQATEYWGHSDYNVMQVVLCDRDGRFPGDPRVSRQYEAPLL